MILANTEELHDQIESLQERIRALEDALRALQASVSTQPHPLLANSLLYVPPASSASANATPILSVNTPEQEAGPSRIVPQEEERDLIDTFGRFSIASGMISNNVE